MVVANEARTLRSVDGFRELAPEDLRAIAGKCTWNWYRTHQLIFSRGDATNDVFFIVQGRVRITTYSLMGKEVTFRDLNAGESFGDLAAIDNRPRSATAVAISDSLLASLAAPAYWQTMMRHPPVAAASLRRLAHLVRALSDRVIESAILPVPTRIKLELFRMAQQRMRGPGCVEIDPAPTHAEIAARVATHREAVTRELRRLTADGIVVRRGRKLLVADLNALGSALDNLREVERDPP
jgi:CRP/FNR family transcriptional regulator, cyclic AMP receptor protein